MNLSDLTLALNDLKWKYPEGQINLIFETVKTLPLEYEDILQVGLKSKSAPSPKSLIKHIKELIVASELNNDLYEVIRLDADDDYHRVALDMTINEGWINPMLFICISDLKGYLQGLMNVSSVIYEIAWIWLFHQDYKHNLPAPGCNFPKLWDMYGIEVF